MSLAKIEAGKPSVRLLIAWTAVVLLVTTITMSPRLGEEGLLQFVRFDDVLLIPMAFALLFYLKRLAPLAKINVAFLSLYLFTALVAVIMDVTGWIASDIPFIIKMTPVLKSVQFLIYLNFAYLVASHLKGRDLVKKFLFTVSISFIPTIIYGLYQLGSGTYTGYYGIGILNEISPTLAGAVYFFAVVAFCGQSIVSDSRTSKIIFATLSLIAAALGIMTGSRGAFVSILTFGTLIWAHYRDFKFTPVILVSSICILVMNPIDIEGMADKLFRFLALLSIDQEIASEASRIGNWTSTMATFFQFAEESPVLILTGIGSGGMYIVFGELMNAADSQFVYTFITGGVLGTILYFFALFTLYRTGRMLMTRSGFALRPVFLALFWAFIAFSFTQEVFVLSKSGGLFSVIGGILIGLSFNSTYNGGERSGVNQGSGITDDSVRS